jgi:hypothetical protein
LEIGSHFLLKSAWIIILPYFMLLVIIAGVSGLKHHT